jgi:exonuclease III
MPKILSYNINGIRAALNKGLDTWMDSSQADIVCLQEVWNGDDRQKIIEEVKSIYPYGHTSIIEQKYLEKKLDQLNFLTLGYLILRERSR